MVQGATGVALLPLAGEERSRGALSSWAVLPRSRYRRTQGCDDADLLVSPHKPRTAQPSAALPCPATRPQPPSHCPYTSRHCRPMCALSCDGPGAPCAALGNLVERPPSLHEMSVSTFHCCATRQRPVARWLSPLCLTKRLAPSNVGNCQNNECVFVPPIPLPRAGQD